MKRLASFRAGDVCRYLNLNHGPPKPLAFNAEEFFKSFVYEMTPPIVNLPIIMLLERSAVAGWHVSGHRMFFPRPPYTQGFLLVAAWLTMVPMQSILWISNIAVFVVPAEDLAEIDLWMLLLADAAQTVRWLVIATKYSFFTEEALHNMRIDPPAPVRSLQNTISAQCSLYRNL